jgi:hypothetical protein
MKRNFVKFLTIFCLGIGSAHAQWAGIITPDVGASVQCNNWGWVEGNHYTVWDYACAPLQVKSSNGDVYSVDTTEGACQDDEVAIYQYRDSDSQINFLTCSKLSKDKQSHHK